MLKVLVIDRCEYCDGEAYVYAGEHKDADVERPVYQACQVCSWYLISYHLSVSWRSPSWEGAMPTGL